MRTKTTILNASNRAIAVLASLLLVFAMHMANGNTPKNMTAGAKEYPFVEDFESTTFPPTGWSIVNQTGASVTWVESQFNHTPDGSKSVWHNYGSGNHDGWLCTPAIALPAEGSLYLSFWSLNLDPDFYVDGKNSVMVSAGSSDPASGDFVEVWTTAQVTNEWVQSVVNLGSYAGQTVYLAFRYEGNFAHSWVLDDISLGLNANVNPQINLNVSSIEYSFPASATFTKSLTISNTGYEDLTYSISIAYNSKAKDSNWLLVNPEAGLVSGLSSSAISLTFNTTDLPLGSYTANLTITSNAANSPVMVVPVILNVVETGLVAVSTITEEYTFPTGISDNGQYVSGQLFGGTGSYFWQRGLGFINIEGDAASIANNGVVAGNFNNPDMNSVLCAGTWKKNMGWTALGVNPFYPNVSGEDYNIAYGTTADGTVVVGMQYVGDWSVKAFKWTQGVGYEMIGQNIALNSRANGISAQGEVIYGWAETTQLSRTPVIWHNNQLVYINAELDGESFGASHNGQYVTGTVGIQGFIWSAEAGVELFDNMLNGGVMQITTVLNDKTVFGFTNEAWPPFPDTRRAFVRDSLGNMFSFNDYASSRGMVDAQDWIFYAISDITPDYRFVVGAGKNPQGQDVTFVIDFDATSPQISVDAALLSQTLDSGDSANQQITISNTGTGELYYSTLVQYQSSATYAIPKTERGKHVFTGEIQIAMSDYATTKSTPKTSKDGIILHYDGPNLGNAIGVNGGGTFYTATRFGADLTSDFVDYKIHSVDVFILNQPTQVKLKIWTAGTTTNPGQLVHEQTFTPEENAWKTVILNQELVLSGSDIWVGMECTNAEGSYPVGVDGGPAHPDGGYISQDNSTWERISDYGLSANWNTRVNIQYAGINWLSVDPEMGTVLAGESMPVNLSFNAAGMAGGTYHANLILNSNDFDGTQISIPVTLTVNPMFYNLVFSINDNNGVPVQNAVVRVNEITNPQGVYNFTIEPGSYSYSVEKENYEEVTGSFTMENEDKTIEIVLPTVSLEELGERAFEVYPNPVIDVINVTSSETIQKVHIYDMAGKKWLTVDIWEKSGVVPANDLAAGMYVVEVVTNSSTIRQKIQIR